MFKLLIVIPARYDSTRFPGKPLVEIRGKSMLRRVWEQAIKVKQLHPSTSVLVATDDLRIFSHVKDWGGDVVLTSDSHVSGTDRCFEAADTFDFEVLVNVQGDEPFILPDMILKTANLIAREGFPIATLCQMIQDPNDFINPNCVKVVKSVQNAALYFSRAPIPFQRDVTASNTPLKHTGIYGFSKAIIPALKSLQETRLEQIEKLEQLRWLENGFRIGVKEHTHTAPSVDTPEDLISVEKYLKDYPEFV